VSGIVVFPFSTLISFSFSTLAIYVTLERKQLTSFWTQLLMLFKKQVPALEKVHSKYTHQKLLASSVPLNSPHDFSLRAAALGFMFYIS